MNITTTLNNTKSLVDLLAYELWRHWRVNIWPQAQYEQYRNEYGIVGYGKSLCFGGVPRN